ncbi:hypothetical protein [Rhodococcus sp. KBS0724]|nr:hypothetical protein [Rhodococcus sp. KBS0724]
MVFTAIVGGAKVPGLTRGTVIRNIGVPLFVEVVATSVGVPVIPYPPL